MKKLLIGLLVVAAGAGAFYFFNQRTCNKPEQVSLNKELIIGKWKPVSKLPVTDTAQVMYQFDFQKDGIAMRSLSDTIKADTILYEWNKANELVVKENASDTIGKAFAVEKLTADTLQVQSKDNAVTILLTKAK